VRAAAVSRLDVDDERMRLVDDVAAAQKILLRPEAVLIDLIAEARQRDAQIDVPGIERPSGVGGPGTKLGRHAGLEDRELDGEVAVPEHASVVRTALDDFFSGCSDHRG
jgi:predicted butyrate kinase (DUF1464 family)